MMIHNPNTKAFFAPEERMTTMDFARLMRDRMKIHLDFSAKKPFRYTVIDNFLDESCAESISSEFPEVDPASWVDASGLHTKNKWTQPVVEGSVAEQFYCEANSDWFRKWLSEVVLIDNLLEDPALEGAGLHQTLAGGYLDVHVDFNKHRQTGLDRRLNLIVFLSKSPAGSEAGALELWDMTNGIQLTSICPKFNRCVIFETNEISFHGHPKPWKSADGESRKTLSVYYYTAGRADIVTQQSHGTLYVNTEGLRGIRKILMNGTRDLLRFGPIRRRIRDRKV